MPKEINIATNNGDIGGGEVMLFNIARALRSLGHMVTIVGPASPSEVVEVAADEGFDVVCLPATKRKQYMAHLRMWDQRSRKGLLWCNGLVPSFATAGHQNRIVHLHQVPQGMSRWLVKPAQRNALVTLIPSDFGSQVVKKTRSFHNWVDEITGQLGKSKVSSPVKIGFIGRPSVIKGTDILANAIYHLNRESNFHFQLIVAGESDFIDAAERNVVSKALTSLGADCSQIGKTNPAKFYEIVDIIVVPSVWDEVFGLVAAEAMSGRKPLLVSDAGALPEVVGKDYPWIFERNNVHSLAEKILEVTDQLENDPAETEKIINSSYSRWQEEFSPEAGKVHLRELLLEIL